MYWMRLFYYHYYYCYFIDKKTCVSETQRTRPSSSIVVDWYFNQDFNGIRVHAVDHSTNFLC